MKRVRFLSVPIMAWPQKKRGKNEIEIRQGSRVAGERRKIVSGARTAKKNLGIEKDLRTGSHLNR